MRCLTTLCRFALLGIRYSALIIVTSYAGLGALLAISSWDLAVLERLLFFCVSQTLFVAGIYFYNDWSGWVQDPSEPSKRGHHAMKDGLLTGKQVLGLSIALAFLSLVGYAVLSPTVLCIAVLLQVVTLLYSHPRTNLKGMPFVSYGIHFLFPFASFLSGWILFSDLNGEGLGLAIYMGLLPSSGHFSHEVEHAQEDAAAGIKTHVSVLGQRGVFRLGLVLFLVNSLVFCAVSIRYLDSPLYTVLSLATLSVWTLQAWRYRGWKEGDSAQGFRTFYRWMYAVVFFCMLAIRGGETWLH